MQKFVYSMHFTEGCVCVCAGIELRALHMQGKCFATELHTQPKLFVVTKIMESTCVLQYGNDKINVELSCDRIL
jgi:hypothetical protein